MFSRITGVVLAILLAGLGGAILYAERHWRGTTKALATSLNTCRHDPNSLRYDETEVEGLPSPVARYFRTVLRDGQPIAVGARLKQEGYFRIGDNVVSWRPLTATQVFNTRPPGFVWDARIRVAPGLPVLVRDAYCTEAASMRVKVLGLVDVLDLSGMPELAAGALQRYLAEAVWIPTALLPSQGVQWSAIDDSSARAKLTDGKTTISLEFQFNAEGEITSAFTMSRYREVGGVFEATPWECRYAAYAERDGMRIPLEGEAEWHLPDRRLTYWRGWITEVAYERPNKTEVDLEKRDNREYVFRSLTAQASLRQQFPQDSVCLREGREIAEMTGKAKNPAFGLEVKTVTGKSGRPYLVFRTRDGSYHIFREINAKKAARDCGAEPSADVQRMWASVWKKMKKK